MKCSKCGLECNENSVFCTRCGTKIEAPPTEIMTGTSKICQNCGNELNENSLFCPLCGYAVHKIEIQSENPEKTTYKQVIDPKLYVYRSNSFVSIIFYILGSAMIAVGIFISAKVHDILEKINFLPYDNMAAAPVIVFFIFLFLSAIYFALGYIADSIDGIKRQQIELIMNEITQVEITCEKIKNRIKK